MHTSTAVRLLFLAALATLAPALDTPSHGRYGVIWADKFIGPAGALPAAGIWDIITDMHVNNEEQTYSNSNANLQLSGFNTLQIIPRKSSTGAWTSARIQSKYTFTPADNMTTFAEASLRLGNNAAVNKQGLWPAFWMLGDSIRHGTGWPASGEIDIFEAMNGNLTGYSTAHCGVNPGGPCNEPDGLGGMIDFADNNWHRWSVMFRLMDPDWMNQSVSWWLDGKEYFEIKGKTVGDEAAWDVLCNTPLFFVLNVAVGGDLPGPTNSATIGGTGSMMEVGYVAVYESNTQDNI